VDVRHHHVEQDELRAARLDRRKSLLGARSLLNVVALPLELDPQDLAHPLVVVDEQHGRAGLLPSRPRAGEERLEIAAAVPAVASRGVEGGDAALIRPLADRALGDAEEACGLPERQPLGIAAGCVTGITHAWKLTKTPTFYTWMCPLRPDPHGS